MKRIYLLLFCALIFTQTFAQAPSNKTIQNHQNWFTYFGQYKFNSNWGAFADAQFRMDEDVKFAKQNVLRTGLYRNLNPKWQLAAGYAYVTTHNPTLNAYATEQRITEQVIYAHKLGKLNMSHRLRLEQRFVERLSLGEDGTQVIGTTNYGNRIRYSYRTVFDLTKDPDKLNVFYVALQDEIFLNVASPEINKNFIDQNRFLLAFGINHDKKHRLELGYMNQLLHPYNKAKTMNHILQISVQQTIDFSAPAN